VKPVAMIADAIKDVSHRGGIVLDLFGGSGSTLIAALRQVAARACANLTRFIVIESSGGGKLSPKTTPNGSVQTSRAEGRSPLVWRNAVGGGRRCPLGRL
jgi:DNA methylase